MQKGWKKNLAEGAPLPELWLCSPLTRTADTMRLSFGDILDGQTPILKEVSRNLRCSIPEAGLSVLGWVGIKGDLRSSYL
jgi:hypothetical protein